MTKLVVSGRLGGVAAAVLFALVLPRCAEPSASGGPIVCQADVQCPPGMVCRSGQCAEPSGPDDGGADGGLFVDGGALDGGSTDVDGGLDDGGADDGGADDDGGLAPDAGLLDFGEQCRSHDECTSGLCLQTRTGSFCTRNCRDDCPQNYVCKAFVFDRNQVENLCIPYGDVYCVVCQASTECPASADRCTDLGGANYCTKDCSQTGACPPGYDCRDIPVTQTVEGRADAGDPDAGSDPDGGVATVRQCVPQSGLCPGCIDNDGDHYGVGADCLGPDCDDTDPTIHPGATEICDGKDNNCDGVVDEGFNLKTDDHNCGGCGVVCDSAKHCCNGNCVDQSTSSEHCGACGNPCVGDGLACCSGVCHNTASEAGNCGGCGQACLTTNASQSCDHGACHPACASGFGDCDSNPRNGCETSLDSALHCGACDRVCTNGNGSTQCLGGHCIPSCNPGFSDCDGNPDNGCETNTNTSLANCGGCGSLCDLANASEVCSSGTCQLSACNDGWGNCDHLISTGCETNLKTDVQNCGDCGRACTNAGGPTHCGDGGCVFSCSPGYYDCNGDPTDGCETNLAGASVCNACTSDTDCPDDFYCVNTSDGGTGLCHHKHPLGDPCVVGTGGDPGRQCSSDHCIDGVCCENECTGGCRACNLTTTRGFCSYISPGTPDPRATCSAVDGQPCLRDGRCDGAGGCRSTPSGTTCEAQGCAGGVQHNTKSCDGFGNCQDANPSTLLCLPFVCNGTSCYSSCNPLAQPDGGVDGGADGGFFAVECAQGYECAAGDGGVGFCRVPPGTRCSDSSGCGGRACVDGVCCDGPCNGLCERCDLPGHLGACTAIPQGSDPDNECPTDATSTCGRTGACSGVRGQCEIYPSGTVCEAQSCTSGVQHNTRHCDGIGGCQTPTPATADCFPFVCNGSTQACFASCASDAQCATNYGCAADGMCRKINGQSCSGGGECKSGICADGVCCNATCGGVCEKCNQSGHLGSCDPIPGGQTDPDAPCTVQAASTCGQTGLCSGSRTCSLYASGTQCAAASCTADLSASNRPDTCNGLGGCTDNGTIACNQYKCNPSTGTCRSSCASTNDCASGYSCKTSAGAGQFTCLKNDGASCTSSGECLNNACCSGVCRNTATDLNNCGQCGSVCNLANASDICSSGVCSIVSCNTGFGNCDGVTNNGCERSLRTVSDCGACNAACNLANATSQCPSGTCQVASCLNGFADCDGIASNGCEVAMDTCGPGTTPCANNVYLGSFQGDSGGCSFRTSAFGRSEARYNVYFSENSSGCDNIEGLIQLSVPAGVDYDLIVSVPSDVTCQHWDGSAWQDGCSGINGTGQTEYIFVGRADSCIFGIPTGSDESFSATIDIRWFGGASCGQWGLYVSSGNSC